jgi:hypothetical protein
MKLKSTFEDIKKLVGVWLDYSEANIISKIGEDFIVLNIPSGVDPGKPKGGHRSKTPYGPMDKISEGKILEKRKHQLDNYYKLICDEIVDCDEVFIMGPAQAKIGLKKYMSTHKALFSKLKDVLTIDSITENQKVEKVKHFYKI